MRVISRAAAFGSVVLALALASCTPNKPADESTTSAPSASAPAAKTLDLRGLKTGAAPGIAWASGTELNGDADVLPANIDQFAETKQLLVIRDTDGKVYAYAPEGPVGTTPIGEATGGLAINTERNLVAWIAPDGSPTVLQEGEAKPAVLEKQAGVTAGDAVAVRGHDCFNGPETVEGAGCSVYFRSTGGEKPTSYVASNHGFVEQLDPDAGQLSLEDADDEGDIGWDKVNENDLTTCSRYTPYGAGEEVVKGWRTCDHQPLSFSADGKHVLATGPHGFEGLGASSLSVLDRATGKDLFTASSNLESQAAILSMDWEDATHVLAVVLQGRKAGIVRVGLDGSMEFAGQPVELPSVDDVSNFPFRLSVQP